MHLVGNKESQKYFKCHDLAIYSLFCYFNSKCELIISMMHHSSHQRALWGQCCCSSQCSSSVCCNNPWHSGSKTVVQGAQDVPVWHRCEWAALGRRWWRWKPCRPRPSHNGSQSSDKEQWCSYTTELQRQKVKWGKTASNITACYNLSTKQADTFKSHHIRCSKGQ